MNDKAQAAPSLEEQMVLKNPWGHTKEREFAEVERRYQELRKQREAFRDEREDRLYQLVTRCSGGSINMDAADVVELLRTNAEAFRIALRAYSEVG